MAVLPLLLVALSFFLIGMDTGGNTDPDPLPALEETDPAVKKTRMLQEARSHRAKAEQVTHRAHQVVDDVMVFADDLSAIKAALRDRRLASQGFAPEGWKQPEFEAYEADPARPSFLPLESVAEAVAQEACAADVYLAYLGWHQSPSEGSDEEDGAGMEGTGGMDTSMLPEELLQ
tara:strand:- start:113 stop:637 length:525 start_codon:yes stop_codon:yes gene_type:complete